MLSSLKPTLANANGLHMDNELQQGTAARVGHLKFLYTQRPGEIDVFSGATSASPARAYISSEKPT